MDNNYSFKYLITSLIPFIDYILGNEFVKCLEFKNGIKIDDISQEISAKFDNSKNSKFFHIIKLNINQVNIEEMILFYLETKIMKIFDLSLDEKDFFDVNNPVCYYLRSFIFYLENCLNLNKRKNNEGDLTKLFSIAYIKCYYYKLINYFYKDYEHSKKVFELLTEENITPFKISVMFYILKLVFRYVGNSNQLEMIDNDFLRIFYEIIDKIKRNEYDLEKLTENKNSGFDFIV